MANTGNNFYRIGRAKISRTSEDNVVNSIKQFVLRREGGYICVSNLRTVVIANKDDNYHRIMENSLMNTPDGTPLVWCARFWGLNEVKRSCGPHIMERLLREKDVELKHFFLGDTEDILAKLIDKAKSEMGAEVVKTFSPPFKPLNEYDLEGIAKLINDSGANIVWTSLRAPKQDFLNAMLMPYLKDGIVLVGVGAAFRTILGMISPPDGKLQKFGLVGFKFRRQGETRIQQFVWYFEHSLYLFRFVCQILTKRLFGKDCTK